MNPNFDAIGKQFVSQYYQVFDNKEMRPHVAQMYLNNVSRALPTGTL